jgi:hypothetical protein
MLDSLTQHHMLSTVITTLTGSLFLAEAGTVGGQARVVHPHPQFRLILALDPRHGEVSRAMRNRGIELFLLPPPPPALASFSSSDPSVAGTNTSTDAGAVALYTATSATTSGSSTDGATQGALPGTLLQDACAVVVGEGAGAGGPALVKAMGVAHVRVAALAVGAMRRPPTLSQLRGWVRLVRALLQRGWSAGAALKEAWDLVRGVGVCVRGALVFVDNLGFQVTANGIRIYNFIPWAGSLIRYFSYLISLPFFPCLLDLCRPMSAVCPWDLRSCQPPVESFKTSCRRWLTSAAAVAAVVHWRTGMQTGMATLMPSCQIIRRAVCPMLSHMWSSPKHLYNSSSTSRACSSFS